MLTLVLNLTHSVVSSHAFRIRVLRTLIIFMTCLLRNCNIAIKTIFEAHHLKHSRPRTLTEDEEEARRRPSTTQGSRAKHREQKTARQHNGIIRLQGTIEGVSTNPSLYRTEAKPTGNCKPQRTKQTIETHKGSI